ncbi:MAG: lipid-A-disaccharide synthase [Xanthomonadaceae bacterium]|nr:lipid-A-disaccharide synthase [Xanthomonadaceae bacterium]
MAGLRVAVIAGEASGDILGAGLVDAIRVLDPDAEFRGIAGPRMQAVGVDALFAADELSVLGLAEVLGRLPRLLKVRRELVAALCEWRPDVYVGIDSPDFNLPVARKLRGAGMHTVQYVSPTVWAWRPGRVKGIARAVDCVLCLFPFEPSHYEGSGTDAVFVGHPLADQLVPPGAEERVELRKSLGLDPDGVVLAVLPGSRRSELTNLGPAFAGAIGALSRRAGPVPHFIAPMLSDTHAAQFARMCERYAPGVPVQLVREDSRRVLAAADFVLTKSGTASLEALLLDRPMVVGYRVAPLTAWILRTFGLLRIRAFAMPNLLAGGDIVPELIQEACTAESLAAAMGTLLDHPDTAAAQRTAFAALRGVLKAGASARAAAEVVRVAKV